MPPIIPLVAQWNTPEDYTARPVENKMGMGGISDRARDGLNPVSANWNVRAVVQNYAELDGFLFELAGRQPFRFSYDGSQERYKLYICKEWEWGFLGPQVWEFRGSFEQVFRPALDSVREV